MRTLIYADIYSYGTFHKGFNSSSLKMMSGLFDRIHYYANHSSYKNVIKDFDTILPNNVTYSKINIQEPKGKISKLIHHLQQLMVIFLIIFKASEKDLIYFNSNPLLALPFINFLLKILDRKVIVMCHIELEFIKDDNYRDHNKISIGILKKFKSESYKWANNLYFCCLGNHIKENAKTFLSSNVYNRLLTFEHTWIFDDSEKNIEDLKSNKEKVKIGLVGTIRKDKWLDDIFYLRKKLSVDDFSIKAIGRVFCESSILKENNIGFVTGADEGFISSELMKKEIDNMDYIVFLYPKSSFKLTASGSIFDAINSEKFVLALHNDCFDSLFKKAEFGKLYDSLDEMIESLSNRENNLGIKLDYKAIKNNLKPESSILMFKEELENHNLI